MKKKPRKIPAQFGDPKPPPFGDDTQRLDLSDEFPGQAPQSVLPQQAEPTNEQTGSPPQMW